MADGRENNPSLLLQPARQGLRRWWHPCHLPLVIITAAAEPGVKGVRQRRGKTKSCCSILWKIMKPTRPAPRTRAALPGDVPGDVPGSLWDPPGPGQGTPAPQLSRRRWGRGTRLLSAPSPAGSSGRAERGTR